MDKYRVWHTEWKEFVTDYPICMNVLTGKIVKFNYGEYSGEEDVEDTKYILSKYTGLKDKHGVKIFEGDILKGPMDFGPAGFVESVAPVSYHKVNGYQLHYFLLEHTEVIGNVYEDKNIKFGTMEEWWIVIADGLLKW